MVDTVRVDDLRNDPDWQKAFEVANDHPPIPNVDFHGVVPKSVSFDDIELIYGAVSGEPGWYAWMVAGQLKNGLYFFLHAGTEFDKWGPRSAGTINIGATKESLWFYAMTEEARHLIKEAKPR